MGVSFIYLYNLYYYNYYYYLRWNPDVGAETKGKLSISNDQKCTFYFLLTTRTKRLTANRMYNICQLLANDSMLAADEQVNLQYKIELYH